MLALPTTIADAAQLSPANTDATSHPATLTAHSACAIPTTGDWPVKVTLRTLPSWRQLWTLERTAGRLNGRIDDDRLVVITAAVATTIQDKRALFMVSALLTSSSVAVLGHVGWS